MAGLTPSEASLLGLVDDFLLGLVDDLLLLLVDDLLGDDPHMVFSPYVSVS